jgi:hypothetical protein
LLQRALHLLLRAAHRFAGLALHFAGGILDRALDLI